VFYFCFILHCADSGTVCQRLAYIGNASMMLTRLQCCLLCYASSPLFFSDIMQILINLLLHACKLNLVIDNNIFLKRSKHMHVLNVFARKGFIPSPLFPLYSFLNLFVFLLYFLLSSFSLSLEPACD